MFEAIQPPPVSPLLRSNPPTHQESFDCVAEAAVRGSPDLIDRGDTNGGTGQTKDLLAVDALDAPFDARPSNNPETPPLKAPRRRVHFAAISFSGDAPSSDPRHYQQQHRHPWLFELDDEAEEEPPVESLGVSFATSRTLDLRRVGPMPRRVLWRAAVYGAASGSETDRDA